MSNPTRVLHPKCGIWFGNSNTEGHCAACCETFIGLEAFDAHRRGGKCTKPIDGKGLSWLDSEGRWHYSRRMTPEVKALRRGQ